MKRFISLISLILVLIACKKAETEPKVSDLTANEKSAKIIAADNQFGFELFKKVNASLTEQKNTMISPLSVSLALAMVYNGTAGNTKTQMEQMLHKAGMTPEDINQSYKDLVAGLTSHDPKVELSISNAIYYRNTFNVKDNFITTNQNYYQAEVSMLDFLKANESMNTINGWVDTNTKGKIDKIIEELDASALMYLLNAIYFNGQWKYQFEASKTLDLPFTKEDKMVVAVPTMAIESPFNYYSDPGFQMLEMPYGSGKYSMLVFLPGTGKTTDEVISLLNPENINEWIQKMTEQKMKVYLPKFEFAFENSLVDELEALGMTDAFKAFKANLTGISEEPGIFIFDVKHKTFIKVDEQGTEAAAVTAVIIDKSMPPPPTIFKADHPFVFAIREKDTQAILFIGKVMNPLED